MFSTQFIRRMFVGIAAALSLAGTANAAGGGIEWDSFPQKRVTDLTALQNGAKLFSNYCLSCHAAAFKRYNRLVEIGLTEQQIADNLIFTGAKVGETMKIAMQPKDAKDWFGGVPPDLTLIARSRSAVGKGADSGADYLYTFLRSYYRDDSKATGWNNAAYPNVGMPHVLWELQGSQTAVFEKVVDAHDPKKYTEVFKGLQPLTAGTMTPEQYNAAIADLVAYLVWMAEPIATDRVRLGVWVLLFISIFIVIAWRLNAAFWKDVK
jgi:ubiquinol-cytochrome c reductase cytochrome c1 subunit